MSNRRDEIIKKFTMNTTTIKKMGVKKIGLFGSLVTGKASDESDIDILVEFEEDREKFSNLVNLYFFLEDLLGKKIDLVTTEGISPYIRPHILKEVKYIEGLS